MPKELKQVRTRMPAKYGNEVGYIGKADGQTGDGSGGGAPMNDSTITSHEEGEEVVQVEEGSGAEAEQGQSKGILGDLPEDVQNYVKKKAQKAQGGAQGGEDKAHEEDVQIDQGFQAPKKSVEELIGEIFDGELPPELKEKAKKLEESIENHVERASQEEKKSHEQNFADTEGEVNTPPDEQEGAESNEKPQGEAKCTESERAFLDAFMALQEAGSLLGMCPSGRAVAGSAVRNVRLLPVVDDVKPSDKLYLTEIQSEQEVFGLMSERMKVMFSSMEKMLKDKGI